MPAASIVKYILFENKMEVCRGEPKAIEAKYGIKCGNLFKASKFGCRAWSSKKEKYYEVRKICKDGTLFIPVKNSRPNQKREHLKAVKKREKEEELKLKVDDEHYYNVKYLLNTYGNALVVEEPTELIKRLEKDGINVWVKHYPPSTRNKKQCLERGANVTIKEDWVLTRC